MRILGMSLLGCTLLIQTPAWSQNINLERIGHFGGVCRAQDVEGNYAFVGEGPEFVVLDLAKPGWPEKYRTRLEDTIVDIEVDGNYALAGTTGPLPLSPGTVAVFDVSNLGAPEQAGLLRTSSTIQALAIKSTLGILATSYGVYTTDLSDPEGPDLLEYYEPSTSGQIVDIAVQDDIAVVAPIYGPLEIVDISKPPKLNRVALFDTPHYHRAVAVDDYRVAFAGWDGVEIIDISDPMHPALVSTVIVHASAVALAGNMLYVGYYHDIYAIDISNPSQPVMKDTYSDYRASGYEHLTIQGADLYACAHGLGFQLLDVANPSFVYSTGVFETPISPECVAVSDNYLFTSSPSVGTNVANVLDPTKPVPVVSGEQGYAAYDIKVHRRNVFEASSSGIRSLKVANGQIVPLDITSTGPSCPAVELHGDRAYAVDNSPALRVFDVSAPQQIRELGSVGIPDNPKPFALSRTHAYVPMYNYRYGIVDIRKPKKPVLVADVPYSDWIYEMAGTDHRVFVATYNGVDVLDVTNAAQPQAAGKISFGTAVLHVSAFANMLFACPSADGLVILDISQEGAPRFIGRYEHQATDVAYCDGIFYVAGGDRGVDILRYSGAGSLPAVPAPTRVQASDGDPSYQVTITWDRMAGADQYDVWRGDANSSKSARLVGSTDDLAFNDRPPTTEVYRYWVTAHYGNEASVASEPDFGHCTELTNSGYVTVVSPNGGEAWRQGKARTLRWEYSGSSGAAVRIELLRKGKVSTILAGATPNDGNFRWDIPDTIAARRGYSIRIVSLKDEFIRDESDDTFRIRKAKR